MNTDNVLLKSLLERLSLLNDRTRAFKEIKPEVLPLAEIERKYKVSSFVFFSSLIASVIMGFAVLFHYKQLIDLGAPNFIFLMFFITAIRVPGLAVKRQQIQEQRFLAEVIVQHFH